MLHDRSITCIVPAKGASQRLSCKNHRVCNDKPLVAWPLILQWESGIMDNYLLSTDSKQLKDFARHQGFPENYTRPEEMALTRSSVWTAVRHAMRYMSEMGAGTDWVAIMHPTSPCIRPKTIKAICEHLWILQDTIDAVIAVARTTPFVWNGTGVPDFSKAKRTQDHPCNYMLTNAFFVAKWDKLMETKNMYSLDWSPYVIDADEAIDIDDETDLHMAEAILQWRDKNEVREPSARDLRKAQSAHEEQNGITISKDAGHRADEPL